jgi:hypothetical protein
LLAVDHLDALALQREENRQFDDVDADRFFVQAAHFEFNANLLRDVFSASHLGVMAPRSIEIPARERSPSHGQFN